MPEGEPDGVFANHATWISKASSWIGWTGSKCFDALGRRCRTGGDFQRADEEGAFPVGWFSPKRFNPPVIVPDRVLRIRSHIAAAGSAGISLLELRQGQGLKRVTIAEILLTCAERLDAETQPFRMTEEGRDQTIFEAGQARRAKSVRVQW